ncbi:diguanylate cyclase (plasmid) [Enterocloster clostridioformis]
MGNLSRYELLFQSLPCGICRIATDADFTILNANSFYYQLYGYTPEQAIEEGFVNVRRILPPRSYQEIHDQVMDHIHTGHRYFELEFLGVLRNGELRWMLVRGVYESSIPDSFTCVLLDISERKEMEVQLRMSMEENKIAFELTDKLMYIFDVKSRTLYQPNPMSDVFGLPSVLRDVPASTVASGSIAPESVDNYVQFYESIIAGIPSGETTIKKKRKDGSHGWYNAKFSTVFDENGMPVRGIIACEDITKQYEKEIAYQKWLQHFVSQKNMRDGYYEFNLTRDTFNKNSGDCLPEYIKSASGYTDFMINFGEHYIFGEDRSKFYNAFDREKLLGRFFEGGNEYELEYRTILPDKSLSWKKASLQMLSDPYSSDVMLFLIVYDITQAKKEELALKEQIERDAMTGLLNRNTFLSRVSDILEIRDYSIRHALIMIDVDHFKELNDSLGHQFGDQVLRDMAAIMQKSVRQNDLCGRLGGDEFIIFMNGVTTDTVVSERMQRLCAALKSQYQEVIPQTSASIGIAFYPRDGVTFDALYQNIGLLATCVPSAFAADVVGGWDEETGYYVNAEAYAKATAGNLLRADSKPVHKGKKERKDISGNTHYRAHGWTTWEGKYHYTRARMETSSGGVLQDSGRQWGTSKTEATSPWDKWDPDRASKARTYYGSEE